MTALILNWQQAYEAGVLTCGGKGYHLAKLHRYGFPVPDGGVVVADIYRQLITRQRLPEASRRSALRAEDVTAPAAQEALVRVQQGITAAVLPMQVRTELEHFLRDSSGQPRHCRTFQRGERGWPQRLVRRYSPQRSPCAGRRGHLPCHAPVLCLAVDADGCSLPTPYGVCR